MISSFVVLVFLYNLGSWQKDQVAVEKGFVDAREYAAAKEAGATTKKQYDAILSARKIKRIEMARAADERKKQAKLEALKLDKEKKAQAEQEKIKLAELAAAKKAKAEQEKQAKCRPDLVCYAETTLIEATSQCRPQIERRSRYSFEWTDSWAETKFDRYRWYDKEKGLVIYIGDKLKFQNGFGAWANVIYNCIYDPAKEKIIEIKVWQGRLPG